MQDPNPLRGTALTIGLVGLGAVVTAVILILFRDETLSSPEVGLLVRVGAVLLAISLVLPGFRRPSLGVMIGVAAALVLILMRPALIWAGLIGWLAWILLDRQRTDDKAS